MYKCSKCGIEVIIMKDTGKVIKPCNCTIDSIQRTRKKMLFGLYYKTVFEVVSKQAPIIAECKANLTGKANMKA